MYETAAHDRHHQDWPTPDPVLIIAATGHHDVSRLVAALATGPSEQHALVGQVTRQLRATRSGRSALAVLRNHGGPDLTPVPVNQQEGPDPAAITAAIADPGAIVGPRFGPSWRPRHPAYREVAETVPAWSARAVLAVLAGASVENPSALATAAAR